MNFYSQSVHHINSQSVHHINSYIVPPILLIYIFIEFIYICYYEKFVALNIVHENESALKGDETECHHDSSDCHSISFQCFTLLSVFGEWYVC